MKVTGLKIETFRGEKHAFDKQYKSSEVLTSKQVLQDSFLLDLLLMVTSIFEDGTSIRLNPVLDFGDDYESIWDKLIDHAVIIDLLTLIKEGKKIPAIKLVRTCTGLDLKQAKSFIDSKWLLEKWKCSIV